MLKQMCMHIDWCERWKDYDVFFFSVILIVLIVTGEILACGPLFVCVKDVIFCCFVFSVTVLEWRST